MAGQVYDLPLWVVSRIGMAGLDDADAKPVLERVKTFQDPPKDKMIHSPRKSKADWAKG